MSGPRAVAVALLGMLAATLLAPAIAVAHAELISSTPVANASLRESPSAVTMTFSEPIDPATASVQLLDELQHPVTGVGSVHVDATALVASVDVPTLEPGVYTVSYRVTSATDGHVTAGIWAFLVDPTGSQPPPAIAAESRSPSGDALTFSTRWLSLSAALMLVGLALFWLVTARPALAHQTGSTGAPWGVIAVTALVAFAALGLYLAVAARPFLEASGVHPGQSGGDGIQLDFAAPFGTTPFAMATRPASFPLSTAIARPLRSQTAIDSRCGALWLRARRRLRARAWRAMPPLVVAFHSPPSIGCTWWRLRRGSEPCLASCCWPGGRAGSLSTRASCWATHSCDTPA
jgi:methionine-rich copper-binding protein CopC